MASRSEYLQIRLTPAEKARLKRLATAAGQDLSSYVLSRALPPGQRRFEELLKVLRDDGEQRYALAELNDQLAGAAAGELRDMVAHADVAPLSLFLQNYVAAMVEHASHLKGVSPPEWARRVEPLDTPWFATPMQNLRLHLLRASPVAFRRRNLFVDASVGARV